MISKPEEVKLNVPPLHLPLGLPPVGSTSAWPFVPLMFGDSLTAYGLFGTRLVKLALVPPVTGLLNDWQVKGTAVALSAEAPIWMTTLGLPPRSLDGLKQIELGMTLFGGPPFAPETSRTWTGALAGSFPSGGQNEALAMVPEPAPRPIGAATVEASSKLLNSMRMPS